MTGASRTPKIVATPQADEKQDSREGDQITIRYTESLAVAVPGAE